MRLVRIDDIFDVKLGTSLALNAMEIVDNGIPFVSRTSKANGVSAFVEKIDKKPNPANTISVAGGGSVLEAFYQPKPYYSGVNSFYLKPKTEMSKKELFYYCVCIRANKYRYNYGREAGPTLGSLKIPHPDEAKKNIANYSLPEAPPSASFIKNSKISLDNVENKFFLISDLFAIEATKGTITDDLIEGDEIPYIAAKKEDNGLGIMCAFEGNEDYISKGNCIVFIQLGEGSAGYSLYLGRDFIGMSGKTSCGYNSNLNQYNALFLVTILDLERPRYSFGRSWTGDRLKNTKIKLPVDKNGEPDWQFMEDYIKSLPYSSNLAGVESNS